MCGSLIGMSQKNNDQELSDLDVLRRDATVSIECAGRLLGISRGHAYELARSGGLPTLTLGERRMRVPSAALLRMLALD